MHNAKDQSALSRRRFAFLMSIGSLFVGKAFASTHAPDVRTDSLHGSQEDKEAVKQSTAAMMIFWVCATRHTLRDSLVAGDTSEQSEWHQTGIPQVLGKTKFEEITQAIRSQPEVLNGLTAVNKLADSFWYSDDGGCPPTSVIRGMVGSTLDQIDEQWELNT